MRDRAYHPEHLVELIQSRLQLLILVARLLEVFLEQALIGVDPCDVFPQ